YDFIGWGVGGTSDVYSTVTITKGTVGNQSYTAKWKANGNTPYTVNIYYMDKNGQYQETPDRTKTEIGATDTTATVPDSAYIKNGFSFDTTKSSNSGTITGDGKLQLSLYYARNQYDITFKSYDGSETLYSYKGYYDTKIEFKGDEPTIEDEDYIYTFTGWTTNKNYQHPLSLGTIAESQTFYAVFDKEATFCFVNFVDTTGFAPLENTTYKLKKGEDFSINLYLANEKYYIGTEQWGLTFNELFVEGKDGKSLKLGTDFTYSFDGYGKSVAFSIPNVTKNLNITFKACYHETHDYNPEFDVTKENATCAKEGEVLRTCYKCGKVVSEKTSIAPDNHTDLKHIDAKAATKTSEGNIEYWYCDGCNKYYKDAKATQEITKEQTVTAKLPSDNNTSTGNNNKPGSNATTLPQTGDNSNLTLWIALLFTSGGAVTVTTVYGRKKKHSVK
ncbi:MAG: LPXTG cell wall anchor domain-containing protein, partial [Butyrivibrio crossotus]|nr:LPXTG cell wall anchor domain-containing protein [Butyrivibrio crossotus]